MVAPLLLLGCSVFPTGPTSPILVHRERLGLITAPVPPLAVYGPYRYAGATTYAALNQPYWEGQRWVLQPHQPHYDVSGSAVVSLNVALQARSLTALHPTLPVPSLVEITNLANECSILVRIVGRGGASYDRLIEISPAVARLLRIKVRGDVRVTYQRTAPLNGSGVAEAMHIARYPGLGCAH
jgi:hypothetical protein